MDKVWLVTGSASGLGRNIAEAVLESGDRLVATARDPRRLDDLVNKFGEHVRAVSLDVADESAAQATVQVVLDAFGRLDVVVSSCEGLMKGPASSSHVTCAGSISTGSETKRKMSRSAPSTGLPFSSSLTGNINKLRCDTLITRGEPENCSMVIRTVTASFSTESGRSGTLNSRSARNQ